MKAKQKKYSHACGCNLCSYSRDTRVTTLIFFLRVALEEVVSTVTGISNVTNVLQGGESVCRTVFLGTLVYL